MTIAFDRWLEMDLTWFDPTRDLAPQIENLFTRIAPLFRQVNGHRGLFFNVGWLIDLVTEWKGNPDQKIPTRSRRTAKWAGQSYDFFRRFIRQLRSGSTRQGLPDLKFGVLFVGWGHVVWPPELRIYDFDSDWYDRHPEIYGKPMNFIGMPVLLPNQRLRADDYPYATYPNGLEDGTLFSEFFAGQWGDVSRFLELDAIHLRDGLHGPMVYTRNGPYGATASEDPEAVAAFGQGVRDLFKQVKLANPDALVFGYSSAISPVADWRVGCVDFETVVADGYIDAWVEQTWGGAWQDWWHQLWKGWTFQLGNLLTRGSMIARANQDRTEPCKFYNLIETWDGWEPWDTIHQVPGKLRWAMWAYSHAAAMTPDGPKVPDGSYISWLNNGKMELLSKRDVDFLARHLDKAQRSAQEIEAIYGPAIVYNRSLMAWLSKNNPEWHVSEWVDDQAAMLMKWGIPILSSTRINWLGKHRFGSLIVQTPGRIPQNARKALLEVNGPVLVIGRADVLDEAVQKRLGIEPDGELVAGDFYLGLGDSADIPPNDRPYLPQHQPIDVKPDTDVYYRTELSPLITGRKDWYYWNPPDWSEPNNPFMPKYQLGSTFPHYRVAMLLHEAARQANLSHISDIKWAGPVAFSLWRSGGEVHLLLGNLETGVFGDSRIIRSVLIHLSRSQLALGKADYQLIQLCDPGDEMEVRQIPKNNTVWLSFHVMLPGEDVLVAKLVSSESVINNEC